MSADPILELRGLSVEYAQQRRKVLAVDGVDLAVAPGETFGIVGESGSGKSTIARAVLGLVPVSSGEIRFLGRDITRAGHRERRSLSKRMQVVFQDPYSSLNPARTVGATLAEPLLVHEKASRKEVRRRVEEMLERVGLSRTAADRHPGSFSGGQRQRIAIARALMISPQLVICDEPVSALDLSVQAQILNLLRDLQNDLGLTYLFIAHDLGVVRYLCHRVLALYRGRPMEAGRAEEIYSRPAHPYTQALLAAAPVPDPVVQRLRIAGADSPTAEAAASVGRGCPFSARCRLAIERCDDELPRMESTSGGGLAACHRLVDSEGAAPRMTRSEQDSSRPAAGTFER